jgi:cellobiose phosphorylase
MMPLQICGEAFYIRDEESGKYWSPSLLPNPGKSNYHCIHGFGYSEFHFAEDGIFSSMTVFVDLEEPVKYMMFRIKNASGRSRKLSLTGYMEWVLGDLRPKTSMQIATELNADSGVLLAGNAYNSDFGNYISFFDVDDPAKTLPLTARNFLEETALIKIRMPWARQNFRRVGAALDACAVLQSAMDLTDSEERVLVFRLGAGKDQYSALQTAKKTKGSVTGTECAQPC